jgi:hypothetical protein
VPQGRLPKELEPRVFALKAENLPLKDVLRRLLEQTGVGVMDRHQTKEERRLTGAFHNVPFWQALDQIASVTGSGISLYQAEGGPALVDGPYRPLPVSYGGLFRTAVKQIRLGRDLEANTHLCNVLLEIAWEPRFQPFYLDPGAINIVYAADKTGAERHFKQAGKGQIPVTGRIVTEVEVQVPAPDRSASTIKSLDGSFSVIGPTKMLTFTFDNLKAGPTEKSQEGISASLSEFAAEDPWTVKLTLQYPKGGPRFESYQSWLGNNKIYLEKIGAPQRWVPNGERIVKLTSSQAVIEYYFENPSGKNAAAWRLVYTTPGPIVEITTPFRFKDLLLP